MSVETLQHPEIDTFTQIWRGKGQEQAAEELASYSLETKRIADPYYYLVNGNGELMSPTAHCRIRDVVQRTQPLGELEYQALLKTEQWVKGRSEGVVAWVSPPHQGIYPTSKVIISEIQINEGVKILFNRAIVLDYDEKKCFEFAQSLANYSQDRPLLSHLDEIRATPFVLIFPGSLPLSFQPSQFSQTFMAHDKYPFRSSPGGPSGRFSICATHRATWPLRF